MSYFSGDPLGGNLCATKTFRVTIPIVGTVYRVVTASTKEEAIQRASHVCTLSDVLGWKTLDAEAEAEVDLI